MRLSNLCLALALSLQSAAHAASVNYGKLQATAGVQKEVRYHATGKKDCTAAPPPTVIVIDPPTKGLLVIRQATLTTERLPGCPKINLPASVVYYTANDGSEGRDRFIYQEKDVNGDVQVFDFTVQIAPAKPAPAAKRDGI
jgi:hypothetical protein